MTREEAIKKLEHYRYCLNYQYGWFGEEDNEAIDMAISALSVIEQTKWERDTALATLEEHGIGLGQIAEPSDLLTHEEAWAEIESDRPTESTNTPINTPTDLISRADAVKIIAEYLREEVTTDNPCASTNIVDYMYRAEDMLKKVPSVSAEPTTRERKEAKSTLLTLKHLFEDEQILKSLDVAIECVSAERVGVWIPCSEKLPDYDEYVLATTSWGDITIAERLSPTPSGIIKDGDWFIAEGEANAEDEDIIAWQPLPKPYEENEE